MVMFQDIATAEEALSRRLWAAADNEDQGTQETEQTDRNGRVIYKSKN